MHPLRITANLFLLFIFFSSSPNSAFAQERLKLSCGGTDYVTIPEFKEDSMQSFFNWFNEHGIISPIKESKADWELRLYAGIGHLNIGRGSIMTIKCAGDSVVFEDIHIAMNSRADSLFKKASFISFTTPDGSNFYVTKTYLHPKESTDSILKKLVKERVFTINLADTAAFIHEKEKQYEKENLKGCKDRCQECKACSGFIKERSYRFFEIKVKNHFRGFRMDKMIYYNLNAPYSDESYLGNKIFTLFVSAFNNSERF